MSENPRGILIKHFQNLNYYYKIKMNSNMPFTNSNMEFVFFTWKFMIPWNLRTGEDSKENDIPDQLTTENEYLDKNGQMNLIQEAIVLQKEIRMVKLSDGRKYWHLKKDILI